MELIKIDRPYLVVRISQAEVSALKSIFEALLPQLKRYESIKFVSRIDSEIKEMLKVYEDSKLEVKKNEPL